MLEESNSLYANFTDSAFFLKASEKAFGADSLSYKRIVQEHSFVRELFSEKKRLSGEPYLEHLVFVASLLLRVRIHDVDVIIAGLLHDTCEDIRGWHFFKVWWHFNFRVAVLVLFVTKIGPGSHLPREWRRAIFYFLLSHGPFYSKVIKLCDRIHNLRTIGSIEKWKQLRMLEESTDKYAPLALSIDSELPGIYQMLLDAIMYAREQVKS
jgi:GTP pyrophosphokinase